MNIESLNEQMRKLFHAKGYKGAGIIFVPLDTGVDENHKELCYNKNNIRTSKVLESPMTNNDEIWHGSFVTGQLVSNSFGWCPDARVLHYDVFPNGMGSRALIMQALADVLKGAKADTEHKYMINMSLSGSGNPDSTAIKAYEKAIDDLVAENVSVFVAAGNDGKNIISKFPSCFQSPITVSALNADTSKANFSTWHNEVDFGEHGVSVLGIAREESRDLFGQPTKTTRMSGTSMACPNLLGKAGLLQSEHYTQTGKWLTDNELYEKLKSMAIDINNKGFDPFTGHGFVQLKLTKRKEDVMRKGDKGEQVKKLQERLLCLGYELPKYGADGDFGSETESAVKDFQSDVGLLPIGIVDKETWDALFKENEEPPKEEPVEPPTSLVERFVSFLKEQIKQPYVWGAHGQENLSDAKIRDMDGDDEDAKRSITYINKNFRSKGLPYRCFDCSGFPSRFLFDNGFVPSKRNCNHLAAMCEKVNVLKGGEKLKVGDLVFRYNGKKPYFHVGVHIGNNKVIEAMSRDTGVVVRDINASEGYWNRYGTLKLFANEIPEQRDLYLTSPLMKGADVEELQSALAELGYEVGTIDGVYGSKTDNAVKLFKENARKVTDNNTVDKSVRKVLGL